MIFFALLLGFIATVGVTAVADWLTEPRFHETDWRAIRDRDNRRLVRGLARARVIRGWRR